MLAPLPWARGGSPPAAWAHWSLVRFPFGGSGALGRVAPPPGAKPEAVPVETCAPRPRRAEPGWGMGLVGLVAAGRRWGPTPGSTRSPRMRDPDLDKGNPHAMASGPAAQKRATSKLEQTMEETTLISHHSLSNAVKTIPSWCVILSSNFGAGAGLCWRSSKAFERGAPSNRWLLLSTVTAQGPQSTVAMPLASERRAISPMQAAHVPRSWEADGPPLPFPHNARLHTEEATNPNTRDASHAEHPCEKLLKTRSHPKHPAPFAQTDIEVPVPKCASSFPVTKPRRLFEALLRARAESARATSPRACSR